MCSGTVAVTADISALLLNTQCRKISGMIPLRESVSATLGADGSATVSVGPTRPDNLGISAGCLPRHPLRMAAKLFAYISTLYRTLTISTVLAALSKTLAKPQ